MIPNRSPVAIRLGKLAEAGRTGALRLSGDSGGVIYVSEGDIVANRWIFRGTHTGTFMGVAPTARSVRVAGMAFSRVSHERIVEIWVTDDSLTMLTQLGAILFP